MMSDPTSFEVGDSIYFADLTGKGRAEQILVKDRYRSFWVYNNDLTLRWSGQGNIGHYPYSLDVDGDKREEIIIGYAMWSPDGRKLWDHDKTFQQHSDAVVLGNFSGDLKGPVRAYSAASDEGFIVWDLKGNLLKRQQIGHTQSPAVGKFRPDLRGLQLMTVNFWRNPGIVTLYDADGNILAQDEPIHGGSPCFP